MYYIMCYKLLKVIWKIHFGEKLEQQLTHLAPEYKIGGAHPLSILF